MTGYVFATGACISCHQIFSFNPLRVPSTSAITGKREPICRTCYERIQQKRKALELPPFPDPLPDAYEPIPEGELP